MTTRTRSSIFALISLVTLGCTGDLEPGASQLSAGDDLRPAPALLADTGLYADLEAGTLAEDIRPFEPEYRLWTDGAEKNRWIYLPPESQIDTRDMDAWVFPIGTKVWKELSYDGLRIETRMMEKQAENGWLRVAYAWRADQSEALVAFDGVENAIGTEHDIPSAQACASCHDGASGDNLLGVSAIQLDHDLSGLNLEALDTSAQLSEPPTRSYDLPGDATTEAALGYLHANCGHCHNDSFGSLQTQLSIDDLSRLQDTALFRSAVGQPSGYSDSEAAQLIAPGSRADSVLFARMKLAGQAGGMPLMGTETLDDEGVEAVGAFIDALAL